MIMDNLGLLRGDGSSPRVTATEAGHDSKTRDATTGQAVIEIVGTPQKGLPIVVLTDADTGTSTDKTLVATIEACDAEDFASGEEVVATFPAVTHGDEGLFMVRRIHTQKKYIRCVITAAGSDGTISVDFLIFIGNALMNRDS